MTEYQLTCLLQMKERVVQRVEAKKIAVAEAAAMLGVSRQGLLKLRKQYRLHGAKAILGMKRGPKRWHRPWNRTGEELEALVIDFAYSNPLDGPISIAWKLEDDQGIKLPHQTIYNILKRGGVIANRKRGKRREWQEVLSTHPGQRIQIDTCFPWGHEGPCVIEAVDIYSRWAYGQLFDRATMENAVKFVKMFVKRAPFEVTCFQPDNGPEFKSIFKEAVESLGMQFDPIPPYSPNCNGRVERLHRTTKHHHYYLLKAGMPLEEMNYQTELYFDYYNWKRRHQGKGMNLMTPMMKVQEYVANNFIYNGNLTVIQYKV
jgi:transposase InsO family protein